MIKKISYVVNDNDDNIYLSKSMACSYAFFAFSESSKCVKATAIISKYVNQKKQNGKSNTHFDAHAYYLLVT